MTRHLTLVMCVTVCAFAHEALARLSPAPGGKVSLALPAGDLDDFLRAHLEEPLLESTAQLSAVELLARPALSGWPAWRSQVISAVEVLDEGATLALNVHHVSAVDVARSIAACFDARPGATLWPSLVARALDLEVRATALGERALVRFDRPVGSALELLSGCVVQGAATKPSGSFVQASREHLEASRDALGGEPSLTFLELRRAGDPADLAFGAPSASHGGALLAPYPDVLLLFQSRASRGADPLFISAPDGAGRLQSDLELELLVDVYGAGRGDAARGLLPPGLAPARPLDEAVAPRRTAPLTLAALPASAPRVPLHLWSQDELSAGIADRLAVLLRANGYGVLFEREVTKPLHDGIALLRWRAPTADAALALLALIGRWSELKELLGTSTLTDPRLLDSDADVRLAAALELERRLLATRAVVPLVSVDRWLTFDPMLRGVRLRVDGVPLLHDAWWGGER